MTIAFSRQASADDSHLRTKYGLGFTFGHLKKGEPLKVGYFGGSITEGAGASSPQNNWRAQTTLFLQERFPSSKVTEISAAIGGTGSDLGAFRCQDNLLSARPDLVFVEFAVNDFGKNEDLILRSMEGIVRQIKRANPQTEIVFVYTASKAMESFYAKGLLPPSVLAHQKVAAYYGVLEVNIGQTLFEKVTKDHAGDWKSLTRDNVHPNDEGYAVYARQIKDFLLEHENDVERGPQLLTVSLTQAPLEGGRLFDAWDLPETNGWTKDGHPLSGSYPHQLMANNPDAGVLSYRFNGNAIGLYWLIAPDSGDIEWSIDGGDWKRSSSWDKYALDFSRAHYTILDSNIPEGQHELKLRVAQEKNPQSTGNTIRIGALLVNEVPAAENRSTK